MFQFRILEEYQVEEGVEVSYTLAMAIIYNKKLVLFKK